VLGVLVALGAVAGLVKIAIARTTRPVRKTTWAEARLAKLERKLVARTIRLDEAEDGLVLARKLGRKDLTPGFAKAIFVMRKIRPLV
jgi:hypothetical protein